MDAVLCVLGSLQFAPNAKRNTQSTHEVSQGIQ